MLYILKCYISKILKISNQMFPFSLSTSVTVMFSTHDKKPPSSPQPGGGREVTGRVKSPASHLSSSPSLKAQKKPQDRKKNKKNKPVVDIPPTPKESF